MTSAPQLDPHGAPTKTGRWSRGWRYVIGVPLVALGIVAVSILSGVATWRASEWSSRADRLERLATQDDAFDKQSRARVRSRVDQYLRSFGTLDRHSSAATRLDGDATAILGADPALAQRLTRQAQHERALADDVLADPPTYDARDLPVVEPAQIIRALEADDPDLVSLSARHIEDDAKAARDKATNLVGVALVLAAALLFLTLAQLTRQTRSRGFAVAGSLVAGAALVVLTAVW